MVIQIQPMLFKIILKMVSSCKHSWQKLHSKLHLLLYRPQEGLAPHNWPPVEQMSLAPVEDTKPTKSTRVVTRQWPLNDDLNAHHYAVIREVEFFPDPYQRQNHFNYTVEGDDPNLRITHFPPSNRLH